jgi:Spy/CpxP family protein refolding chaperone
MKKNLTTLFVAILCVIATTTFAQRNPENMKKIKAMHIAMMSTALNLDEATSQKFWPVYNTFSSERKLIRQEKRVAMQQMESRENATDAELQKAINTVTNCNLKEADLQKKYNTEFLKVISAKQLASMYNADKNFKEMLVERLKNGRNKGSFRKDRQQANPLDN